jgi:hypothetical protein
MSLFSPTWWKIAGLAAVAGIGYFVYATCPCTFNDFRDVSDWSLHISSLPGNCATLSVTTRWIKPDDTVGEKSDVQYYELRRSTESPEEFLIGMRGKPPSAPGVNRPVLYSVNKFAFRFHQQDSHGHTQVDNVRPASEEQWAQAQTFLQFDTDGFQDVDPRMVTMPGPDEVLFNGRPFPKANTYSEFSSRRMVSAREVFIAVPSRSGPEIGGHGFINIVPDPWWRRETIEIFRVDTRARVARISGWACAGGGGQTLQISWQGDEILTMPISRDEREVLLCRFNRQ